jgi:hypothetical protein
MMRAVIPELRLTRVLVARRGLRCSAMAVDWTYQSFPLSGHIDGETLARLGPCVGVAASDALPAFEAGVWNAVDVTLLRDAEYDQFWSRLGAYVTWSELRERAARRGERRNRFDRRWERYARWSGNVDWLGPAWPARLRRWELGVRREGLAALLNCHQLRTLNHADQRFMDEVLRVMVEWPKWPPRKVWEGAVCVAEREGWQTLSLNATVGLCERLLARLSRTPQRAFGDNLKGV